MKNLVLTILLIATAISGLRAQALSLSSVAEETMKVHYLERFPFSFVNAIGEAPSGIEMDILQEFVTWARDKKGRNIKLEYTPYKDFEVFYGKTVVAPSNVVGCGNVTIIESRKGEVDFSSPYLKNISVLVSEGTVPTLDNLEEVKDKFKGMTAVTTRGSVHASYIEELKNYYPELKIEYVDDQNLIPQYIIRDKKYFGYIDIVSYWNFFRTSTTFTKMHRIATKDHEFLGFIFPKKSDFRLLFSEFFESGFGFTSTRRYEDILERYLGFEILNTVEID